MADVDKIKGNFYIYSNGEYVVLPGTKLYILRTDGSLVTCRSDLRHAGRITFLSGNRMLLCSSKKEFHMIDLHDGSDIWVAPYTKFELNVEKLAISPDGAFAYTVDQWRNRKFISRLDLETHEVDCYDMYMDSGATRDICCDEEGVPCLLKTLTETIGGKTFHQVGVRLHDFFYLMPGSTTEWKTKWYFEDTRMASCFFDGPDRIVTNDLCVYEPATGKLVDLLENDTKWQRLKGNPCDCWLDLSKRYLCVKYRWANVIIDILDRKVVAQYAADYKKGCLVGDEYWICIDDRICRKPFPAWEDALPEKPVGLEWYYSKHPEFW